MICSICKKGETSVVDSRPTEDGTAIRRRRLCSCGERFTTFERVQFRELTVIKKNGRRSPFDREKLAKSLFTALKKRPLDNDTIEKVVSKISRELEELGQSEIQSNTIGKKVMDALKELESKGVKIHKWSQDILDTLEKAWMEVVEEESKKDTDFKRSWESLNTFRKNIETWKSLGYL